MWVRGHSRSCTILYWSTVVPLESLGTVSYSPFIVTMAVSVSHFGDIQRENDLTLNFGFGVVQWRGSIDMHDFLLVRHCNYSSILYGLRVI